MEGGELRWHTAQCSGDTCNSTTACSQCTAHNDTRRSLSGGRQQLHFQTVRHSNAYYEQWHSAVHWHSTRCIVTPSAQHLSASSSTSDKTTIPQLHKPVSQPMRIITFYCGQCYCTFSAYHQRLTAHNVPKQPVPNKMQSGLLQNAANPVSCHSMCAPYCTKCATLGLNGRKNAQIARK